jgi:hypothetical protein
LQDPNLPTTTFSAAYKFMKKTPNRQACAIANHVGFRQSAPRTGRLKPGKSIVEGEKT